MFFKCGIRMSFRQVRKPQAKNRVETIAMALRSVFSGIVEEALPARDGVNVVMAAGLQKRALVYLSIRERISSRHGGQLFAEAPLATSAHSYYGQATAVAGRL